MYFTINSLNVKLSSLHAPGLSTQSVPVHWSCQFKENLVNAKFFRFLKFSGTNELSDFVKSLVQGWTFYTICMLPELKLYNQTIDKVNKILI